MKCSHISKKMVKCQRKTILNSKFCYLKSHYSTANLYKKALVNMKENWIKETYPNELFVKTNVPEDGWCFFVSFGMSLLNIYNKKTTNKKIIDFFKHFVTNKVINNKTILVEEIKYKLLTISRHWLFENLTTLHDVTKEPLNDFIMRTNNIETIDEYFSLDNIENKEKLEEEKWGGICDQYSLSKYFEVNVISFLPTRYSFSNTNKEYKIMLSKVVKKNITRYKLTNCCFINNNESQILSILTKSNINDLPINNTVILLLFILNDNDNDNDNISHYNYLTLNI